MAHLGVKDVRDLLDSSNYNFVTYTAFITKCNTKTNYIECYKTVSALIKTGKMFPQSKPHSFFFRWKKLLPKTSSLQKKLSHHFQKKDFIASEKPGKVAF